MTSIHEQARAEAEKRYPLTADPDAYRPVQRFGAEGGRLLPASEQSRTASTDGKCSCLCAHLHHAECDAVCTWYTLRNASAGHPDVLEAVLSLHRPETSDDTHAPYCAACGANVHEQPNPWPCDTVQAIDAATRAGGHDDAVRADRERIIALLDGIDRTQDDGGWWETSTGAEHGAAILTAIRTGSVDTHTDTPGEDTRG